MKYASLEMIFKHCEFAHFLVGKKKIWTLDFFGFSGQPERYHCVHPPEGKLNAVKMRDGYPCGVKRTMSALVTFYSQHL